MAGLVPATHAFGVAGLQRRGCPRQARAWRVVRRRGQLQLRPTFCPMRERETAVLPGRAN